MGPGEGGGGDYIIVIEQKRKFISNWGMSRIASIDHTVERDLQYYTTIYIHPCIVYYIPNKQGAWPEAI